MACEYSNRVRDAFLAQGCDAYSCDLRNALCPNKSWKRHIVADVRPLLLQRWDLVIAHPPCTYLANSGSRYLYEKPGRWQKMLEGVQFFNLCLTANAKRVVVENPIMHKYGRELISWPYTQIIQPWQFGDNESKATCLWIKGLPELKPTHSRPQRVLQSIHQGTLIRKQDRSITFQGIADAMAAQWSKYLWE